MLIVSWMSIPRTKLILMSAINCLLCLISFILPSLFISSFHIIMMIFWRCLTIISSFLDIYIMCSIPRLLIMRSKGLVSLIQARSHQTWLHSLVNIFFIDRFSWCIRATTITIFCWVPKIFRFFMVLIDYRWWQCNSPLLKAIVVWLREGRLRICWYNDVMS